jgi:hypothetical protein
MTIAMDSQNLESFVPVYDAIPSDWDAARPFIVEQLRKISDGVNIREIGWYLDQELLSGKAFIPGINNDTGGTSQEFRQILRIVVVVGPIIAGLNTIPHRLIVDYNFTLIQLWASATNSSTFRSVTFSNPDTIYMDATNIYITSDGTYDRCNAVVEYLQEI